MYDFLTFSKNLEGLMEAWREHTVGVLSQSTDLGFVREHFVKEVLGNFLPKSVVVGSGEIIDGNQKSSGQQDVIIYRADFPVLTSLSPINTYIAEGVIATIEVKSDLSSGNPNGLSSAFRSVSKVRALTKHFNTSSLEENRIKKAEELVRIRCYVVGYSGWKEEQSLQRNFAKAYFMNDEHFPDVLYQPEYCVLHNDGLIAKDGKPLAEENKSPANFLLNEDWPLAMFLHHFLVTILRGSGSYLVSTQDFPFGIPFNLGPYFDFGEQRVRTWYIRKE
jgi:hypothetical protein